VPVSAEVILDPGAIQLIHELDLHMKAASKYNPPFYEGEVHTLQCSEDEKNCKKMEEWVKLASLVTVSSVNGTHHTCMKEPFIESIAQEVTRLMDEAIFKKSGEPPEGKNKKVKVLGMSRIVHRKNSDLSNLLGDRIPSS